MPLPPGIRVVAGFCVFFGLVSLLCDVLNFFRLTSFYDNRIPRLVLGAVAFGIAGMCSLVAGCYLLTQSRRAWASARPALWFAVLGYVVCGAVDVIGGLDDVKFQGQSALVLVFIEIAVLGFWVVTLSNTAKRLTRHLEQTGETSPENPQPHDSEGRQGDGSD